MTDSIRQTIDEFEQKRQRQLADVADTERTINMLLQHIGEPSRYADPGGRDTIISTTIKRGQFYGIPLATAVTQFLETRRREPATNDEIMDALIRGGFAFEWAEEGRIRSLAMSLSKNPKFHRLPDASWGLRDWYSNLPKKPTNGVKADEDSKPAKSASTPKAASAKTRDAKATKATKPKAKRNDVKSSVDEKDGEEPESV